MNFLNDAIFFSFPVFKLSYVWPLLDELKKKLFDFKKKEIDVTISNM